MTVVKNCKYIRRSARQGFKTGGGQNRPPSILINILQHFFPLLRAFA